MHDPLVVGAGPYGLSVASPAAATVLGPRVFGRPTASWRAPVPAGRYPKSESWASVFARCGQVFVARAVAPFTAGSLVRGVRRPLRGGVPGSGAVPAPGGLTRQGAPDVLRL
ncbi:hypothetical protein [Streptomyces sp. NPDC088766]|uniref:hypothetical protein n=1 Tax=Streptomyces sp. NPDC088766 TaxID=3365893 RepID=UPI0038023459